MKKRITSLILASTIFINGFILYKSNKYNGSNSNLYEDNRQHTLTFDDIVYNYEGSYISEEEVNKIVRMTLKDKTTSNTEISIAELTSIIISNSTKESANPFGESIYIEILDDALKQAFSIPSNTTEDILSLSKIKVITGSLGGDTVGEYSPNTKTITIDVSKIKSLVEESSFAEPDSYFQRIVTHIMAHELNHVRQYSNSESISYCSSIESIKAYTFTIEASAESGLANCSSNYIELYCYPELRNYECLFLLMAALKDNARLNDYYRAVYDVDIKKLYDLFDLKTEEDYQTFYRIGYSLDALSGMNELGKTYSPEEIGYASFLDIYKIVVEDLATLISQDKITNIDAVMLYHLIKSMICTKESLNDSYFVSTFPALEDAFMTFIKDNTSWSIEEFKANDSSKIELTIGLLNTYPILYTVYNNYYQENQSIVLKRSID